MKTTAFALWSVLLGLTLLVSGCAESRADRNGSNGETPVRDDGGIDIQAPGVDLKINTEGVRIDVDTDGDGDPGAN